MLHDIISFAAKAVLGVGLLVWPISGTALARGQGHHSSGQHSGGHQGGSSNWHHGGSNWNGGYYGGGYFRGYPYLYNYGYRYPYRGGYGYYPYTDYGYYPDYGYNYDDSYVTAAVEPARITVQVPPDATVLVNGVRMSQTGTVRQYVTPPLEGGYQYSYEVRASWMTPAGPINNSRTVWVDPGDNVVVDLNRTP